MRNSPQQKILLLSNTKNPDQKHLEHATDAISHILGKNKKILFIPYAEVTRSFEAYTLVMREVCSALGYQLDSIDDQNDPLNAIAKAEAIFVGGGNTFHLLYHLRAKGLIPAIQNQVAKGVPYIGSSAGANVACPTIKTTNDMPIIDPNGFESLNLVPFQINPHFTEIITEGNRGETRVTRIQEFNELHPNSFCVGLREGSMLQIEGSNIALLGASGACVFRKGISAKDYFPGDSIQFLLNESASDTDFINQKIKPAVA